MLHHRSLTATADQAQASLSLRPGGPLAASEATLEEAHGMWVPPTSVGFRLPTPVALSHFINLRALTLQVSECESQA